MTYDPFPLYLDPSQFFFPHITSYEELPKEGQRRGYHKMAYLEVQQPSKEAIATPPEEM